METQPVNRRCIVADDVRSSRKLLSQCIASLGIDVETVEDGQAAWERVQRQVPDLVVTDIDMPRMSGLDLLNRLRHDPNDAIRQIPVVVVTGLNDCELDQVVQRFGGMTVLCKPLDRSTVCEMIEDILSEGRSTQRHWTRVSAEAEGAAARISPVLRRLVRHAEQQSS